jgi:hypothetical protein
LFFLFASLLSCSTEPPDLQPTITLTVEDVSCTEAWIKISSNDFSSNTKLTVSRNDSTIAVVNANKDTLLYDDNLLPNQNYTYTAKVVISAEVIISETEIKTLDTTSHIFSYQTFEIGDPTIGSGSILYDVTIINEYDIWAVGEIFIKDSLGQTEQFGVIHWNGQNWTPIKLKYTIPSGQQYILSNIKDILYVNPSEIWFAAGSVFKWDGISLSADLLFSRLDLSNPNASIEKIWGQFDNLFLGIGNAGNIIKYNGLIWQEIESSTDIPLVDIYEKDLKNIYISGAYTPEIKGVLLKGNESQFSVVINSEIIDKSELFQKLYGELASVWVDELGTIYTGGNLLYRYKNNNWNYVTSLPENFIGGNPGAFYRGFISSIRGNASNDYIIAGDRNTLKHFNGVTWLQIGLPYNSLSPIIWYKVEQKENIAVAVGDKGSQAFIILLRR